MLNNKKFIFVCNRCKTVEDSELVFPEVTVVDEKFDPKTSAEMIKDGEMICSACNTGTWHNVFKQEKATTKEVVLASFSKYNAITPYDHPEASIESYTKARYGYGPTQIAIGMFNHMYAYAIREGLTGFVVTDHPLYHKLVKAKGGNTSINLLQELLSIKIEDIGKMIREYKLNGVHSPEAINADKESTEQLKK